MSGNSSGLWRSVFDNLTGVFFAKEKIKKTNIEDQAAENKKIKDIVEKNLAIELKASVDYAAVVSANQYLNEPHTLGAFPFIGEMQRWSVGHKALLAKYVAKIRYIKTDIPHALLEIKCSPGRWRDLQAEVPANEPEMESFERDYKVNFDQLIKLKMHILNQVSKHLLTYDKVWAKRSKINMQESDWNALHSEFASIVEYPNLSYDGESAYTLIRKESAKQNRLVDERRKTWLKTVILALVEAAIVFSALKDSFGIAGWAIFILAAACYTTAAFQVGRLSVRELPKENDLAKKTFSRIPKPLTYASTAILCYSILASFRWYGNQLLADKLGITEWPTWFNAPITPIIGSDILSVGAIFSLLLVLVLMPLVALLWADVFENEREAKHEVVCLNLWRKSFIDYRTAKQLELWANGAFPSFLLEKLNKKISTTKVKLVEYEMIKHRLDHYSVVEAYILKEVRDEFKKHIKTLGREFENYKLSFLACGGQYSWIFDHNNRTIKMNGEDQPRIKYTSGGSSFEKFMEVVDKSSNAAFELDGYDEIYPRELDHADKLKASRETNIIKPLKSEWTQQQYTEMIATEVKKLKKLEDESQAFVAKINKFSDLSYSDLSSLLESSGMDVKSIEKFTVQSNGFDLKDVIDGINSTFTNIKPSWDVISIGAIQSYEITTLTKEVEDNGKEKVTKEFKEYIQAYDTNQEEGGQPNE